MNMNPIAFSSKSSGFGVIEILICIGLMGVMSLGVASILRQIANSNLQQKILTTAKSLQYNFTETLKSENAWLQTQSDPHNQDLSCLGSAKDCSPFARPVPLRPFRILTASGQVF